jgi:hypothetical protein
MGEILFPLVPYLIMLTFVSAILWGILIGTLFDYKYRMDSWIGQAGAYAGAVWATSMALLGVCTFVQAPWDSVYMPMTADTARWPHIVGFVNGLSWLGPQLSGALLVGVAWFVWTRLVRDHLRYVLARRNAQ